MTGTAQQIMGHRRVPGLAWSAIAAATIGLGFVGIAIAAGDEVDPPLTFREHLIQNGYAYVYGIAAADLDGDGDIDLTSSDALPHSDLYWHENDGHGAFQSRFIQRDDGQRPERHAIGDVDGDGDNDVVIVKNYRGNILWFENDGTPGANELWERHVLTSSLPGAYDVALTDLDNDGDLDAAASTWSEGNEFAWMENDGTPARGRWWKHIFDTNVQETRMIRAADIDGDGDNDLVGSATMSGQLLWYENDGDLRQRGFVKHMIVRDAEWIRHGTLADMDNDGDIDVVVAMAETMFPESHQIAWFENDGTPDHGEWQKHIVITKFKDVFDVATADFDLDGDLDIAAVEWRSPGGVAWLENKENVNEQWMRHDLKTDWRSADQVIIADLNGDGRPDIAAAAENGSNELRWWENTGTTLSFFEEKTWTSFVKQWKKPLQWTMLHLRQ